MKRSRQEYQSLNNDLSQDIKKKVQIDEHMDQKVLNIKRPQTPKKQKHKLKSHSPSNSENQSQDNSDESFSISKKSLRSHSSIDHTSQKKNQQKNEIGNKRARSIINYKNFQKLTDLNDHKEITSKSKKKYIDSSKQNSNIQQKVNVQQTRSKKINVQKTEEDMIIPLIKERQKEIKKHLNQEEKIRQIYLNAIDSLQEYQLPDKIPCREQEKETIREFLQSGVKQSGCSNSLYISGVPGIGKTVSFMEELKRFNQSKSSNNCMFIHINAMNLSNPEKVYVQLLFEITGIKTNVQCATLLLNEIFTKGTLPKQYKKFENENIKKIKIILLDELDHLITPNQNLLYNLFDWPHQTKSKIIQIGIANTMDFPERLQNKIASRIGNRRLVFKQYNSNQIKQIIKNRVETLNLFDDLSLQYLSHKIAQFSSDIRRTLNVCRLAVQICKNSFESQKDQLLQVSIEDIKQAHQELYSSPYHSCITSFSNYHKLLLISLGLEIKLRGINLGYLSEIYNRAKTMNSNLGIGAFIEQNEAKQLLFQLSNLKILEIKEKMIIKKEKKDEVSLDPNKRKYFNIVDYTITLIISLDDLTNSLKNDPLYEKFRNLF